ncbi:MULTISPECIES: hypothetical protein [unclassified Streptomyces]|nr:MULTISPECIES: hypothetical protein [unclassified Streptomyces]
MALTSPDIQRSGEEPTGGPFDPRRRELRLRGVVVREHVAPLVCAYI